MKSQQAGNNDPNQVYNAGGNNNANQCTWMHQKVSENSASATIGGSAAGLAASWDPGPVNAAFEQFLTALGTALTGSFADLPEQIQQKIASTQDNFEQVWADRAAVQADSEPRAQAFGGRAAAARAVKCRRIPPGGLQRGGVTGAQCDVTEDVAGEVVEVAEAPVTDLVGHVQDRLGFGAGVGELPGGQPCPAPQHRPDPDVPGNVSQPRGCRPR